MTYAPPLAYVALNETENREFAVAWKPGAGDVFGGSAVWKLLKLGKAPETLNQDELADVVTFACTAAGLSTTKAGGISSVPEFSCVHNSLNTRVL